MYRNGHAFGQYCAVRANKGGRFAELVQLKVLFGKSNLRIGLYYFNIEVYGMRYCKNANRPWAALLNR
jgi:hypothetical protein